ncbi:MAG: hypothetical protein E7286_11155 [Lachnospiraceae bacterium]|nr:hypothetical protein [Lachnospiraceae bacterium]
MKIWKRIFMAVLTVALLLVPSFGSLAAESDGSGQTAGGEEGYTYKVTFSAGVQGTFEDGTDLMSVEEIPAGAKVFFTAQEAVKTDASSKYYVKGVRLAGRDNSEAEMAALTVTVNEDADYVVVYGIKGEQVSYTVNYVDANGNKLAESDIFYGNVGDKPVVAYKYISGYVPTVFGFTKTLSANEAENVFTFVYGVAMEGNDDVIYEEGDTVIVYVDRVVGGISGGQGTGGNAGNGGQGAEDDDNENEGTGTGEGTGGNEGTGEGTGTDDGTGTEEDTTDDGKSDVIVDLDDEEVPLAQLDQDKPAVNMAVIASLAGVSLAALLAVIVMIFRQRGLKSNEEAEEQK